MLAFREFRTGFTEHKAMSVDAAKRIEASIDSVIDSWVKELKQSLISGSSQTSEPRLWDKLKNAVANVYYGAQGDKNPYAAKNKFGQLGEFIHPIHVFCADIETAITEADDYEKLKIFQIIDARVQQLKDRLKNTTKGLFARMQANNEPMTKAKELRQPWSVASPMVDLPQYSSAKSTVKNPENTSSTKKEPTQEKRKFLSLSSDQKKALNHLGGGDSEESFLGYPLPKVLRLEDPRMSEVDAKTLQRLKIAGRVEEESDPIKSQEDLEDMVSAAKMKSEIPSEPQEDLLKSSGSDERFDAEDFDYNHSNDASKVVDLAMDWPNKEEKDEILRIIGDTITDDSAKRAMSRMKKMLQLRKRHLDMDDAEAKEIAELIDSSKDIEKLMNASYELESFGGFKS